MECASKTSCCTRFACIMTQAGHNPARTNYLEVRIYEFRAENTLFACLLFGSAKKIFGLSCYLVSNAV